jgi:hypothetical protein
MKGRRRSGILALISLLSNILSARTYLNNVITLLTVNSHRTTFGVSSILTDTGMAVPLLLTV